MKIGYPCINRSIEKTGSSTFRLKSYSKEKMIEVINNNLDHLKKILQFNLENNLLYFRINSGIIPFASHPICKFNWQNYFRDRFTEIGKFIKTHKMRISMHPDQFILINSRDEGVFGRSVDELMYHAEVLESLKLGKNAKIQLHVGGVYNDKAKSIERFVKRYKTLNDKIKKHLVIENDDNRFSLGDCMQIHDETGIPVLFDAFHHKVFGNDENIRECFDKFTVTWKKADGLPLVDYSSQNKDKRKGSHTEHIDLNDFKSFISRTEDFDFDIMLEIKDKEKSALKALQILKDDERLKK